VAGFNVGDEKPPHDYDRISAFGPHFNFEMNGNVSLPHLAEC
jgi:hypothetical protein